MLAYQEDLQWVSFVQRINEEEADRLTDAQPETQGHQCQWDVITGDPGLSKPEKKYFMISSRNEEDDSGPLFNKTLD